MPALPWPTEFASAREWFTFNRSSHWPIRLDRFSPCYPTVDVPFNRPQIVSPHCDALYAFYRKDSPFTELIADGRNILGRCDWTHIEGSLYRMQVEFDELAPIIQHWLMDVGVWTPYQRCEFVPEFDFSVEGLAPQCLPGQGITLGSANWMFQNLRWSNDRPLWGLINWRIPCLKSDSTPWYFHFQTHMPVNEDKPKYSLKSTWIESFNADWLNGPVSVSS